MQTLHRRNSACVLTYVKAIAGAIAMVSNALAATTINQRLPCIGGLDLRRHSQPLRPPGCDFDSCGLSPRLAGKRTGRSSLGPDRLDFEHATLAVRKVKKGTPATHPIRSDELRTLRRLQREQDPKLPFVLTSERRAPFTKAGFARMVERAGEAAELKFKAHPHMLAMPAASRWPTRATTRALFSPIWDTRTSGAPCAILSWRPIGSRTSGARRLAPHEWAAAFIL
jgi:hypothetical protein